MGLPQHAKFKVERTFDNSNGMTSPEASVAYGTRMLRFRDASILLIDDRLYSAYKKELEPARPVHTSMKTIVLNVPLGDVLVKDGKESYVPVKEGGLTELIQVDDRLLTIENKSKSKQIIKAESNWKTTGKDDVYVTRMLEGNDQVSTGVPNGGCNKLSDIVNLLFNEKELKEGNSVKEFLKEYGGLKTYLFFQEKEIAGGLASAGDDYYFLFGGFLNRRVAGVPRRLSYRPGVVIYTAAEGGAKVGAARIESAPKEIKIVADGDFKAELAAVKQEVENAANQLMGGALAKTQAFFAKIEAQIKE